MNQKELEARSEKVSEGADRFVEMAESLGLSAKEIAHSLVLAAASYIGTEEALEEVTQFLIFSYTMMEALEKADYPNEH